MSTKRRDHKNRVLRPRESQCKDGRYRYTYYLNGKQKSFYSWKLEPTDKMPAGARPGLSLREKVAELQRQEMLFGNYISGDYTVLDLVERYVAQKQGVQESTKEGYKTTISILKRDIFGKRKIKDVKISDAKMWIIGLQNSGKGYSYIQSIRGVVKPAFQMAVDDGKRKIKDVKISDAKMWIIGLQNSGKGYSYIQSIRGVVKPAFQMAVDDDLLLKNPFNFMLQDVIKNDSQKRISVTPEQQERFLEFIKTDQIYNKYYDAVYILFHTGLRISEFCGLTLADIDMKDRIIHVNHQLLRLSDMRYMVTQTKTGCGVRDLPMTQGVYECFERILKKRRRPKVEPMIDKKAGFLFMDKNGMPKVAGHWQKNFQNMVKKYNRTHTVQLPEITTHVCRHTYCSNQAKAGMNPKTLQYLMGHSDISVTMNVYTHINFDDAEEELRRMEEFRKAQAEIEKKNPSKPTSQVLFKVI